MDMYVKSVGLRTPGMEGWEQGSAVLKGENDYLPQPLPKYKPQLLPPNERRRATELVRLAFAACEDAVAGTTMPLDRLASVFASSGGDYPIIDQICRALTTPERMVSPTQFHNSVHNSAAGYWGIATGSQAISTSLSARDESAATGLLEAAATMQQQSAGMLLAIYDIEPPQPLKAKRPIELSFSTALLLTSEASDHSLAKLTVSLVESAQESICHHPELERLRTGNPAARMLPVLECLAAGCSGEIIMTLSGAHSVRINIS